MRGLAIKHDYNIGGKFLSSYRLGYFTRDSGSRKRLSHVNDVLLPRLQNTLKRNRKTTEGALQLLSFLALLLLLLLVIVATTIIPIICTKIMIIMTVTVPTVPFS
jgi:hypothetical protein